MLGGSFVRPFSRTPCRTVENEKWVPLKIPEKAAISLEAINPDSAIFLRPEVLSQSSRTSAAYDAAAAAPAANAAE